MKGVVFMTGSFTDTAVVFKAFCDENRIRIIDMLKSGEKCACRLLEELEITQPTLSHHMKIMCDAGIVTARKEGKWTHYSLNERRIGEAAAYLSDLTNDISEGENRSCCRL